MPRWMMKEVAAAETAVQNEVLKAASDEYLPRASAGASTDEKEEPKKPMKEL